MNKHYVTVTSQIRCLHAHVRLQADLLRSTWPTSTHFGSGVLFFAIGNYFGLSLGDRNENVTRIDLKLRFHCKCIGMTVLHWAGATCYCSIWPVCWYVWHSSPGFCTFRPCFSIYMQLVYPQQPPVLLHWIRLGASTRPKYYARVTHGRVPTEIW